MVPALYLMRTVISAIARPTASLMCRSPILAITEQTQPSIRTEQSDQFDTIGGAARRGGNYRSCSGNLSVFIRPGGHVVHMNHKVSRFLPGSSNNSLFNLLSLQPGISAATESLENLIIWGSYEGQSRIIFDDMVLFGLENFNDNIGTVNPYVVKDIRLMKAAFGANYGDCVGGIAEITGKDGNRRKFSMDSSLDNYTFNSMLETPVGQHSSLIMAFRHTYRNLYDNLTLDLAPNRETEFDSDVTIIPDYLFRDINLKYTFHNEQDLYIRLSMMAGQDKFSYTWLMRCSQDGYRLEKNTSETSLQKGASLVIGKNGRKGLSGQLVLSYSALDSKFIR
jgi:hypothetical protein